MTDTPDPRLTPARPDVAAEELRGLVEARRYDPGRAYQVSASVLPIRKTCEEDGAQETQALFGEVFTVYDERDGWGWGQAATDGYVGYVQMEGLSAPVLPATQRVKALRTYRFSAPDLKSSPLGLISMNALLAAGEVQDGFVADGRGGWVWAKHLAPIAAAVGDPVTIAVRFIGAPYFWGGRESLGLDCSGLLQNAFAAAGRAVPRDADMQEGFFASGDEGDVLWRNGSDGSAWQDLALGRGDLLFWPGHVAMMIDDTRMVHANATHMATSVDPARELALQWDIDRGLKMRTVIRPKAD